MNADDPALLAKIDRLRDAVQFKQDLIEDMSQDVDRLTAERDDLRARLAAVEALAATLDADLAKADPAHFSIGLMRGRLKEMRAALAAPTDATLDRTANALKGDPAPLTEHGWDDLPDVAARAVAEAHREGYRAAMYAVSRGQFDSVTEALDHRLAEARAQALPLDELDTLIDHLAGDGTREGLILANALNVRFGRFRPQARRPGAGCPMTAPSGFYTRPMHLRDHHVGNWYADCPFCVGETFRATQAIAAAEAARHLEWLDRETRKDQDRAARGLAVAVLLITATVTGIPGAVIFLSWMTQLGDLHAWHYAGPLLLTVTAWCVRQVRKIGQSA